MLNPETPKILNYLMEKQHYDFEESYRLMMNLMENQFSASQIGAILFAYSQKGETPQEIAGFASAMRAKATPFPITQKITVIDNCGTGGDGKRTFNISTASALLAYAMGLKVIKHGNRSVTSNCGSADFLEALGFQINFPADKMKRFFDLTGFAFLYAPLYHPAMKAVQQVRKELGIPTIFNLLGPLTNPAPITHKVIGVCKSNLVDLVAQTLLHLNIQRGLVFWGEPGIDEVSICGITKMALIEKGKIQTWDFSPEQVGLKVNSINGLFGGNPEKNVHLFHELLQGEKTKETLGRAVILNTAFLVWLLYPEKNLGEIYRNIEDLIRSGEAYKKIQNLIIFNQSFND
ncbi:anthranilate phosphoribosyltransferase [Atribacter laminatus]|uniref:Anthranilate phosphoribosyltransferase n=1 Tax=Atribacter laminatus TaxID=2847778 RepID=A0A7T1AJ41_ATRLM|nr:anthranilate phosphoribosyltransferase [Atribacter laminatus]QPM66861.1 Anthranilate phosphoribosyltransferase 2 [Atribacter laminatus]